MTPARDAGIYEILAFDADRSVEARTLPAYPPHSATGAHAVRRGSGSVPPLPALMCSLCTASVFPTSPHP